MDSKSDNIEAMTNDKTNEVIKELFDSLINRYQNNLESMKDSEFFDYIHLLYHKCHKITPNWGRLYIDSPDWIKNKKATINPMNKKNNKCFQYTVTFALNNEEIKKDLRRITKIKSFIDKYNCERINFSAKKDDRRKFEKNNITIALNVLHAKKEEIYVWLMFLKHHANREKQTILLMISNGEKWHYLAVKMLSALLRGITSKHYGYFYCLNCVHSFRTKKKQTWIT